MVMENKSTTAFSDKVSGLVEDAKHNARWRHQFIEYEIQQRYQFNAGKKEGAEQKAIEDAKRALNMHLTVEQVAEITGLSIDQVKELKATVNS